MSDARIADYAPIGDGRSLALVSRTGSIDWLCWPRLDSPSLFASLLDPAAGHWSIRPAGALQPRRRYLPETNVLQTDWEGPDGALEVTDWMAAATEAEKRRRLWPEHALVRRVRCGRGPLEVIVEFAPRPAYGKAPRWTRGEGSMRRVEAGGGLLVLQSDRTLVADGERARLVLRPGEQCCFLLTWASEAPAVLPPPESFAEDALALTTTWWRTWAGRMRYDGPWRALVLRSALAVKLLTFAPSGAIAAAGTTSLPERLGGDLNWDYRFCWVRDASLTVRALLSLGYEAEADAFVSWMLHATRLTRPEMKVLYDLYGREPPAEYELPWAGFRGSRPVRINNGASDQLQLDSYGEVIDAVAQLVRIGREVDGETNRMLGDFGSFVCRNWERPDSGIWEPREPLQHYSHSKVLCWVALERLLELQDRGSLRRLPVERFRQNRDQLAATIRGRAWSPSLGSYVQTLGGSRLDASSLLFSWYGFEDARSERMRGTAAALLERLSPAPGLLYRYDQSIEAGEGAFAICSFWFAEYLARGGGSLQAAEQMFAMAARFANDLGLLSEEIEPRSGELLGNFPQAFSHIGLISAALAIEERRRQTARRAAEVAR
ncbi:glycoside hydrolase family 15 protein [Vulgatibacter sp.]|uniref:glycoside hydrolase family 15 protein n=1 Tax=Vulgatibacter sp. TaxID=1971226 RepID=UPI00356400E6